MHIPIKYLKLGNPQPTIILVKLQTDHIDKPLLIIINTIIHTLDTLLLSHHPPKQKSIPNLGYLSEDQTVQAPKGVLVIHHEHHELELSKTWILLDNP